MCVDDLGLQERLARERSLLLAVQVTPGASPSEVAGLRDDGTLCVRIAAVPDRGKANEQLRSFLSRHFGVKGSDVQIVSEQTSTHKRIGITV